MKNLCKQNWYQITLLFLFCVTVFLRFYKLTVLPDVLHIDEAALVYNSWCLANYGTDRYLNVLPFYPQNFYGGQSPLYTYLVVLLIKFFGKGNLSVFLVRFLLPLPVFFCGSPAPGACPLSLIIKKSPSLLLFFCVSARIL